jgi:Uma2 family endonuclease
MSAMDLLHRRRWSVEEFQRAIQLGLFHEDERLELIHGDIYRNNTPDPLHSAAVSLSRDALGTLFLVNCHLRTENPLTIPGDGQPEPDILVVRGNRRDFTSRHPEPGDVLLLIEVSDSTLSEDRSVKGPLYAEAGIPEFWILNLRQRQLEVHQAPQNGIWTRTFVVSETGTASPLAAPNAVIPVADLLP